VSGHEDCVFQLSPKSKGETTTSPSFFVKSSFWLSLKVPHNPQVLPLCLLSRCTVTLVPLSQISLTPCLVIMISLKVDLMISIRSVGLKNPLAAALTGSAPLFSIRTVSWMVSTIDFVHVIPVVPQATFSA